nr:MFS transporter [Dechloromonas sp.]
MQPSWPQVLALGVAQTVAWASSTYLPAVLAQPLARELGFSPALVFAAFSGALLLMALCAPGIGRHIDRHGGQRVLCLGSLFLAAGLGLLGIAGGLPGVVAAWALIGVGMACGLYDAAFAALVREHGVVARRPITGITLLGGFASTVGWPLTAWLIAHWDWRMACFAWAALNLLLALPLNFLFVPSAHSLAAKQASGQGTTARGDGIGARMTGGRREFVALLVFGSATAFVTSAMAAHLPALLLAVGLPVATAIGAAALVGPAQVAARLGEFFAAHRFRTDPLNTARLATALHPLGGIVMLAFGGPGGAAAFALLHGGGNGMITIAKGTLPLYLFGAVGYGALQGRLAAAQRLVQAAAPYLFALLLQTGGATLGLALSVTMSMLALGALFFLKTRACSQ